MTLSLRKLAIGGATAVAAVGLVATAAPAVAAAPPGTFEVDYDASGTSTIVKPNAKVKLGPTVLKTYIADDASFTGELPLPKTSTTFKVAGFLPVSADVNFIPLGLSGKLGDGEVLTVSATAKYTIRLTNAKIGGLPTFVGSKCQTSAPVSIPVATPKGQSFDITTGGTLAGKYTIGKFANCGLSTALINALVPGPNNTVNFTVSNGRFVE